MRRAIKLLLHTRGTMPVQAVSFASPRVARAPPGFHVWERFVEEGVDGGVEVENQPNGLGSFTLGNDALAPQELKE